MKIKSIEVTLHSCPFEPKILPFWYGTRIIPKRDVMIVKVSTDEGIVGFGEGNCYPYDQYPLTKDIVSPAIIGEDPLEIEEIWRKVANLIPNRESLNLAMGPIDIALYDILGKATGKSVCDLLGGRQRDRIRLYSSAGMYQSPKGYAKEASHFAELGFEAYKYRPGLGPDKDIETIKAIRDAVGEDFEIMVDAHTWSGNRPIQYSYASIEKIAKVCEKLNVCFLEEPFSRGDIFLYNHLRVSVPNLPFAGGEGEKSLFGYEKLIKNESLDIIQTDPTMIGGFTISKKVAEMTKAHRKLFVGHMWSTRLGSITLAHVSATLSEEEAPWQEHPLFTTDEIHSMYPFPLANEILREPLDIKNGYLKMPRGPGLGVDIDEKALEKYQFVPGRWSFYVPPTSLPY